MSRVRCETWDSTARLTIARPAARPALSPQLLPIPHPRGHLRRQPESQLMRQHANLPAMVRFVSQHVAQHLHPNRPGPRPPVSVKLLHAPLAAERFPQHLRAASRTLRQSRPNLLRRTLRSIELSRNLQMRSREPDPLRAHVMHMRKDPRNAAPLARRLGSPRNRIKLFNKHLIHALIRGKDPHRSSPE